MYLPAIFPSSHPSLDPIFYLLFNGVSFRARSFIFFNDFKCLTILFQIIVEFICQEEIMTEIFLRQMIDVPLRNVSAGLFQQLCSTPGVGLQMKTERKGLVDH